MPGAAGSQFPGGDMFGMRCEHGRDRAECIDCSAERTMRQAKTSSALAQLRAEVNAIGTGKPVVNPDRPEPRYEDIEALQQTIADLTKRLEAVEQSQAEWIKRIEALEPVSAP